MEPVAKKLCVENNSESPSLIEKHEENGKFQPSVCFFNDFSITRVLNNSEDKCAVTLEGCFGNKSNEKAVVVLQKLPFSKENLDGTLSKINNVKTLFHNDVYYNQMAVLPAELNEAKITTIYPAEESHIKKYERQTCSFINETPDLYAAVTLPYINSSSYSKQWIYNILEHKKEAERIVCEDLDPELGFVLVPDMKWTGEQMENLYLQALVMRRDILSIRDLRREHIPLLRNIYEKCTREIKSRYGVPASKLRVYFHYQPSYYHLHIHFSALSFEAPGTWAGKAHLLTDVLSNLETDADYYKKATLAFTIKDNHPLKELYEKNDYFKED